MANRLSLRTSSSGRKKRMSTPPTMRAMDWSGMSGKAVLQKSENVMKAPYPSMLSSKW